MIQIIFLVVGIVALFRKSITVTGKPELRRPNILTFGITTIVLTLIAIIADSLGEGLIPEILFFIGIIVPIIMAFVLMEPKEIEKIEEASN